MRELRSVQEVASTAAKQLQALRQEHGSRMEEVAAAAAAAKETRDSDLEIIDRALSAAHDNHEAVRSLPSALPQSATLVVPGGG